jgi:hypothetical protein
MSSDAEAKKQTTEPVPPAHQLSSQTRAIKEISSLNQLHLQGAQACSLNQKKLVQSVMYCIKLGAK